MTGREAAEQILRRNGIYDVQVIHIAGNLTDHYNPGNKTLGLSDTVYNSASVAAIGVAAHGMRACGTACYGLCSALYPGSAGTGGEFRIYGGVAADHHRACL